MGKSASGGELSRLMLALELAALRKHDARDSRAAGTVPTLIFDEIDAGVGGVAAAQLGQRLAVLAQGAQIIVVTHLPQVAAWADQQFVVEKRKRVIRLLQQLRRLQEMTVFVRLLVCLQDLNPIHL